MLLRSDLQGLAQARADDAKALLKARRYAGASYLAGYSIECAIKACIANQTKRYEYPDKARWNNAYSHDFDRLIKIVPALVTAHTAARAHAAFETKWNLVVQWSEESRYDRTIAWLKARDMVNAVTDRPDGILEWFAHHSGRQISRAGKRLVEFFDAILPREEFSVLKQCIEIVGRTNRYAEWLHRLSPVGDAKSLGDIQLTRTPPENGIWSAHIYLSS